MIVFLPVLSRNYIVPCKTAKNAPPFCPFFRLITQKLLSAAPTRELPTAAC